MFQQGQKQKHSFPSVTKPQRSKILKSSAQQPYQIGIVKYHDNDNKTDSKKQAIIEVDEITFDDPGLDVVERINKDRQQRMANYTKDELDKVLKRVDHMMSSYETSVQASLIQHGMTREEAKTAEQIAETQELERLLNDNLAIKRYKDRMMVFIIGYNQQVNDKIKLLEQVEKFFHEQKRNFSGSEFHTYDDTGDIQDDIEILLKSFDVRDCYQHIKSLRERIDELNEDITQFLIEHTGTKQTKVMVERSKRKLAQITKDAKEKLADIQSKLELTNKEMIAKEVKIQTLEKDMEVVRREMKLSQDNMRRKEYDLVKRENEMAQIKRRNYQLEELFSRSKLQVDPNGAPPVAIQTDREGAEEPIKINLEVVIETEHKVEKETLSSRTAKELIQPSIEIANIPKPPRPVSSDSTIKEIKKTKPRDKNKQQQQQQAGNRGKKEVVEEVKAEDPSEVYLRSQQLLESLLADKSDNASDLNMLFKPPRGIDLNHVSIDNLPTAYANLRKTTIVRVRDLLKEIETKELANKDTLQILKQEFLEHRTKYEKDRIVYHLSLNPDSATLQEDHDALAEKAESAHKLQLQAQKTAEEALKQLAAFMTEQEKIDQEEAEQQTEIVHRHSVALSNVAGGTTTPPPIPEESEETGNNQPPVNSKPSTPSNAQEGSVAENIEESKQTINDLPPGIQEIAMSQSEVQSETVQNNRSASTSRRVSVTTNENSNSLEKPFTLPDTSPMHPHPLSRSNSNNLALKEHGKSSSGERSRAASAAQSRRVSTGGLNRSGVQAEEIENILTKLVTDEIEQLENVRQASIKNRNTLRERYQSLLEQKQQELEELKKRAEMELSRPTTGTNRRKSNDSLNNSSVTVKCDREVQTSITTSPPMSPKQEASSSPVQMVQNDQFKLPFFHLYEVIYKFRQSIIHLLEQNKFMSLADRLHMIKQLSLMDTSTTNDFVDNSDLMLKDTIKVLQNCIMTLQSTKEINKEQSPIQEPKSIPVIPPVTESVDKERKLIIEQKDLLIKDLNTRCQQLKQELNLTNKTHEEELTKNEEIIGLQRKSIQNLQSELLRAEHRLSTVENEKNMEPSIMFTRLDAERNEKALKEAVDKGKLSQATYTTIDQTMKDYVHLPSRQFNNLVKQYMEQRKAAEIKSRIQNELLDDETRVAMEKLRSFHQRRSIKISEYIANIRHHRTELAQKLADNFDNIENESSMLLIRPAYSIQGKNTVQSHMKNEKQKQDLSLTKDNDKKGQSQQFEIGNNNGQNDRLASTASIANSDEKLFHVNESVPHMRLDAQSYTDGKHYTSPKTEHVKLDNIIRLQEIEVQRTLLPVAHPHAPLSSNPTDQNTDLSNPSNNLHSYVVLSRSSGEQHDSEEKTNNQ